MSRRGHRESADRRYLYRVWDQWEQGPRLVLLCLSPWRMEPAPGQDRRHRAVDELQAAWEQLARRLGFFGWEVAFLFPRRVKWEQVLLELAGEELVGGLAGEKALRGALAMAREPHARIVAAWGAWGRLDGRGEAVARYVTEELGRDLWALGEDAGGAPLQVLQAPSCKELVLYRAGRPGRP